VPGPGIPAGKDRPRAAGQACPAQRTVLSVPHVTEDPPHLLLHSPLNLRGGPVFHVSKNI